MACKEINYTRADGNIKFHIARTQENHDLEVLPHHLNSLNAYNGACPKRTRFLLAHPALTDNSFIDINPDSSSFQIMQVSHTMSDQSEIAIPRNFSHGYKNKENAADAQFVLAVSQTGWFIRKLFILRTEPELCEIIRNLIRRSTTDKTYQPILDLFNRFIQTKNVEYLLTLYTKPTGLYTILQKENNAFTTLLYLYSKTLVDRAFVKGETFRGLGTTDFTRYQATISDYRWAMQHKDYVLETRTLQSTSKSIDVANGFIQTSRIEGQPLFGVLLNFKFEERCFTAFDIEDISAFPDEEEVLVFPFTLFKVTNIESRSSAGDEYHTITLMNVPTPRSSLITAWRNMKKIKKRSVSNSDKKVSTNLQ